MKVDVRLPDLTNVYGHDRIDGFNKEILRQSDPIEDGEEPDWVYGMYMSSAFSKQGYVWGGPPTFPTNRKYKVFGRFVDLHHNPRKCVQEINSYDLDLLFMTYHYLPKICPPYFHGEIDPDYYWKYFQKGKSWLPWSIDPGRFHPSDEEPKYDITFLCIIAPGTYPLRVEIDSKIHSLCKERGWKLFTAPRRTVVKDAYAEAIRSSKVFIFGTSILGYALRKWVEAMGSGTCILSDPPTMGQHLGFEDGKNFISIDSENWIEKLDWILDNDNYRERIARNAHRLVKKRHTHEVRVKEMFEVLKLYD